MVDWPGIRRFAGASRAVQWAYGAVPAGCGAGHFDFKAGIALHGAAGRHGIPHCAEILAHAERALPAEPGVILAGAAVSGAGAGDEHRRPSNGKNDASGICVPLGERTDAARDSSLRRYACSVYVWVYGSRRAGGAGRRGASGAGEGIWRENAFASVDAHRAGKLFCPAGGRSAWR